MTERAGLLADLLEARWDQSGLFSKQGRHILISSEDLRHITAALRSTPMRVPAAKAPPSLIKRLREYDPIDPDEILGEAADEIESLHVTVVELQERLNAANALVERARTSLTEVCANLVGSIKDVEDSAVAETLRRITDIRTSLSSTELRRG